MIVNHVVAVNEKSVIGSSGDIPWRSPSDLKNFRKITTGKMVLMGEKRSSPSDPSHFPAE